MVRWAYRRQEREDYVGHLVRCAVNLAWFYQPPTRHFPLQVIFWIVAIFFNLLGGLLLYGYVYMLDYSGDGLDFNLIMVAVLVLGTGFLLPTFALNDAINLDHLGKYLDAELRREVLSGEQRRAEEVASGAVLQLNEVESQLAASYVHSGAGLPAVLVLVVLLVQLMAWDTCLGLDLRAFAENVPDAAVAGGGTALLICLFIIEFWLGRRWRARYARQIRQRLAENHLGEKLLRSEISHTQLEQRLPAPLRYLGFLPRLPSKLASEQQRTAWRVAQRLDWYLDPTRSPAERGWVSCLTYLAGAVLLLASAAVILLRADATMPSLAAYLFVTAASVLGALALAQIRVFRMQARVWREELFRHLREVRSA
jgi:hypothetical protein